MNPLSSATAGIVVDRAEGVVTIRLNRQEFDVVRDSAADRAVMPTGADDSFCAGIDLAKPPHVRCRASCAASAN
jgi:enoyl-CoA hydratase/carnithine racemase